MRRHGLPTARIPHVHGRRRRARVCRGARRAHRRQGRRACRRQRRGRRADARGGGCRDRRHAGRQRHGRGGRARRDRGMPGRGRGELHRDGRRQERSAARLLAGPQAVARRRRRPEYRWHGRVLARARRHARDARADYARSDRARRQRHGRRRHPVQRIPLRRRDDRRRRAAQGARVQLPAGRSGNAADHGAAEVGPRGAHRCTRWPARSMARRRSGIGAPRSASCWPRPVTPTRRARATSSRGWRRSPRWHTRTCTCSMQVRCWPATRPWSPVAACCA